MGLSGRMKAKKKLERLMPPTRPPALSPSPPGKWANEKHTLANTVFTREFNYPVFRSRLFLSGFGVAPPQLTYRPWPFNLPLKDPKR